MSNLENELYQAVLSKVRMALQEYLDAVCTALPVPVPKPFMAALRHLAYGDAIEDVERLRKIIDEYCCDEERRSLPQDETDWREEVAEINSRLPELYVGQPKICV